MKKARVARRTPGEPTGTCWLRKSGRADEEDGRDTARNKIVNALPILVEALLEEARSGSVAHMKVLMQLERDLAGPERDAHRGKNLEQILMEQWAKDAANKAGEA